MTKKRNVIAQIHYQKRKHAAKWFAIGLAAGVLITDFIWAVIRWA